MAIFIKYTVNCCILFVRHRLGEEKFYGNGSDYDIDTSRPFTVVTEFVTADNTDSTDLVEIRRSYKQDGKTIEQPKVQVNGNNYDSITDDFCRDEALEFNIPNDQYSYQYSDFEKHGGMASVSAALDRGLVLVMSLWDDHYANMLWLDSVRTAIL